MMTTASDGVRHWPKCRPSVADARRCRAATTRRRDQLVATLGGWPRPSTCPRHAYDRLKAEHDDLTTRGRIDIARKIETARELGDLSENGDYHAAKEEQGKMEGRIRHLARCSRTPRSSRAATTRTWSRPGRSSRIRYEGDDDVERYLLGSIEERDDDLEVISPGSPLGAGADRPRAPATPSTYETPTGAPPRGRDRRSVEG